MPDFDEDDFQTSTTTSEQMNTTSQVSMVVGGQETIAPSKHKEWEKGQEANNTTKVLDYREAAEREDHLEKMQKETDELGSRFRPIPMEKMFDAVKRRVGMLDEVKEEGGEQA